MYSSPFPTLCCYYCCLSHKWLCSELNPASLLRNHFEIFIQLYKVPFLCGVGTPCFAQTLLLTMHRDHYWWCSAHCMECSCSYSGQSPERQVSDSQGKQLISLFFCILHFHWLTLPVFLYMWIWTLNYLMISVNFFLSLYFRLIYFVTHKLLIWCSPSC